LETEIMLKQTFVHGNIQRGAKTKLSKSSVTMRPVLAQLLKDWREQKPRIRLTDDVASSKLRGVKSRFRVDGGVIRRHLIEPHAQKTPQRQRVCGPPSHPFNVDPSEIAHQQQAKVPSRRQRPSSHPFRTKFRTAPLNEIIKPKLFQHSV
jgi:DNA-binding transcriptional LysR family regulator